MQVAGSRQRFSPDRWLRALRARRTPAGPRFGAQASPRDRSLAHRLQIASLAVGVFVLDTVTAVDIVVPVLYVVVVLLAMRSGRKSDIALAGSASVGLTIVSFALTVRPVVPTSTALLNTALSLLAIFCVTLLCLRSIKSQDEMLRTRDRLAFVSRGIFLRTLSASFVQEVTKPIAAIGANAEAACRSLTRSPPDLDETKTATRRIVQDVERLSTVVGRLRRSMAPREVAYETCDPQTLIERAIEHLRFDLGDAGIGVTLTCQPNLRIVADKVLIEQVVVDAISSSIEALRPVEAARRRILAEAKATPKGVRITIEDNGVGVEGAALERIFDPLSATRLGSGTGVGFAVSKSIVEIHDGTMRVFANPPSGLIVEITLPAAADVRA